MTIIACVVTYNRLNLLKLCIEALRRQTRKPDAILVVDNASSDGTAEWLRCESDLQIITQGNVGGAGGFHAAVKAGYDRGFDWIWIMDDDVMPAGDALEMAVGFAAVNSETISAVSSARVEAETGRFVGGEITHYDESQFLLTRRRRLSTLEDFECKKPLRIYAGTFEGMLIKREAVTAVGLPAPEYFLQFDDFEYSLRLNRFAPIYMLPTSKILRLLPGYAKIFGAEAAFKAYLYYCRNHMYYAVHSDPQSLRAKIMNLLQAPKALGYLIRDGWFSSESYLKTPAQKVRALYRICRSLISGVFGSLGRINY